MRLLILEHYRWSVVQKYQAIMDGLSVDDLMNFVKSLKSELYVEGLVQGNFTSAVSSIPQMCPVLIMELKQRNFFVYLF